MGFTFPKFVPTPLSQLIPNASEQAIDFMMKMMVYDPQKRITAAQALKHPFFDGFTHNASAFNASLPNSNSNKNLFDNNNATSVLGSGGKLPASRAMRIESRKGVLSRKSSVNKNSFYKQKEMIPAKPYGGGSSYFNKNNVTNNALPTLGSSGIGNKNSALGNRNKPLA